MSTLDLMLGLVAPIILLPLAVVIYRRKLHKEFPFFFAYSLYASIAGILREVLPQRRFGYFVFYWMTEAIYGILGLFVISEVLRHLFPIEHYRWSRWLLPIAIGVILAFASSEVFYHPLGHGQISILVRCIYWFDVGVHGLEGLALVLVGVVTQFFRISWRKYEFGILTGFGISAFVTMLADLLRFDLGSGYETFFRYGPPIAYLAAAVVWLEAFVRPAAPKQGSKITRDEAQASLGRARAGLARVKKLLGWRYQTSVSPV